MSASEEQGFTEEKTKYLEDVESPDGNFLTRTDRRKNGRHD